MKKDYQEDLLSSGIEHSGSKIDLLNETVLMLNKRLLKAEDIIYKWKQTAAVKEVHKQLIEETEKFLEGGIISYGMQVTKKRR